MKCLANISEHKMLYKVISALSKQAIAIWSNRLIEHLIQNMMHGMISSSIYIIS
jgi:hypothetical protein